MHSTLVRTQNVFGFFTTVAFVIGALIAASDFTASRTPSATVMVKDVQVARGRPHYYSTKREEYATIRFSLIADFSSLFTWNTKQVFIYVSANWPNATSSDPTAFSNEAVIWDTIITSPSADHLQNIGPAAMRKLVRSAKGKSIDPSRGKLEHRNIKAKYQITSPNGLLATTDNVVLKVHYNVQPWVGILTWTPQIEVGGWKKVKGGVSKVFRFPAVKGKKVVSEGTKNGGKEKEKEKVEKVVKKEEVKVEV